MSLSIGLLRTEYLDSPDGIAYEFAQELMWRGSMDGYMGGEGRVWTDFSFSQVMRYADEFAAERALSQDQRDAIATWLESLPWITDAAERYIELYFET